MSDRITATLRRIDSLTRGFWMVTSIGLFATGFGFLVGPDQWSESQSFEVIQRIMPMDALAWLFVIVGAFKLAAWRWARSHLTVMRAGSAAGGAVAALMCLGLVAALATGNLTGWSGIPGWGMIAGVQILSALYAWRPPASDGRP